MQSFSTFWSHIFLRYGFEKRSEKSLMVIYTQDTSFGPPKQKYIKLVRKVPRLFQFYLEKYFE